MFSRAAQGSESLRILFGSVGKTASGVGTVSFSLHGAPGRPRFRTPRRHAPQVRSIVGAYCNCVPLSNSMVDIHRCTLVDVEFVGLCVARCCIDGSGGTLSIENPSIVVAAAKGTPWWILEEILSWAPTTENTGRPNGFQTKIRP